MNSKAKAWVSALESGKYKQARSVLRDGRGGFCCLGVACDISGLSAWTGGDKGRRSLHYFETCTHLPDRVKKALGINGELGQFDITDDLMERVKKAGLKKVAALLSGKHGYWGSMALSTLNDNGVSFADIAAIIRMEPRGLFAAKARKKKR